MAPPLECTFLVLHATTMLKSLAGRLTLSFFALDIAVVFVIVLGITISQILAFDRNIGLSIRQTTAIDRALITAQLRHGRTVSEAAVYAAAHGDRPDFYLYALDARSRTAFNGAANWSAFDSNLAYMAFSLGSLVGAAPSPGALSETVPGGSFWVLPDFAYLGRLILARLIPLLPFLLLSLVAGYYFALVIARYLTEPLHLFSTQLSLLAEGDFSTRPIATTAPAEIHTLDAVYNDAAQSIQSAVGARERAAEYIRGFISDAGHELKTPLTIMMGYLDAIVNGLVNDRQDSQRILSTTLAECRRMRNTIVRLSTLARLDREAEEIGSFNVAAVVGEVVDSMKALAPNLHLEMPAGEEIVAFGDADELREAIVNVIDNAIKYAPGSPIDVRLAKAASEVRIEVIDAGPGMSAHDRDHAFERFRRGSTNGNVEGSGLGLAIVKRAVERANGRITLTSELDRGTAVTIDLRSAANVSAGSRAGFAV